MFTRAQFRISNHKLEIENGRYKNITRDKRFLEYCDSNEIEDVYHFVLKCQNCKKIREKSNPILKTMFQESLTIKTKMELFEQMISSTDEVVLILMSEFVKQSTQKEKFLDPDHLMTVFHHD